MGVHVTDPTTANLPEDFYLFLSGPWFVACWLLVACLRSCSIVFLVAMTWLYQWLWKNPDVKQNTLDMLRFTISLSVLKFFIATFALVALLHCIILGRCVFRSCRSRELTFGRTTSQTRPAQAMPRIRSAWTVLVKWMEPVLFIHGEYFDHYFLMREYLEVLSQIYQAYWMSIYIATRWINSLFVFMIFLNCISTPIIHGFVPSSQMPLRRMLSVMCSAVLDFINSVVIPFVLFFPYAREFDTTTSRFPDADFMDDVWFARAIRENQLLFITTCFDFLATYLPHWSLFSCLATCEDLLRRKRIRPNRVSDSTPRMTISSGTLSLVRRSFHTNLVLPLQSKLRRQPSFRSNLSTTHELVLYNGLWLIGVAVLGLHIAAQRVQQMNGCKLASAPWFTTESSCVIMNINCYRRQIEGNETQIHDILTQISATCLFQLMFTHCPKLQVPPAIRKFQHLGGLDIFNSTMDKWSSTASLHRDWHPYLTYVLVIQSNFRWGIPDGLIDKHFPSHVDILYFRDTNVTNLPTNLHQSWTSMVTVGFDFCKLSQFPTTLAKSSVVNLALVGNPFQIARNDTTSMVLTKTPRTLWLSNSSIKVLPNETMGNLDSLMELQLEYTQISHVPQYVREWYLTHRGNNAVAHSLYGSPYCNSTVSPSSSNQDEEEAKYRSEVCVKNLDSAQGFYSFAGMEIVAKQRAL